VRTTAHAPLHSWQGTYLEQEALELLLGAGVWAVGILLELLRREERHQRQLGHLVIHEYLYHFFPINYCLEYK
jgi:cell division inhibitor SulA